MVARIVEKIIEAFEANLLSPKNVGFAAFLERSPIPFFGLKSLASKASRIFSTHRATMLKISKGLPNLILYVSEKIRTVQRIKQFLRKENEEKLDF